jgi:ApbE superfamily uncharacterized protein (UPF0280 family)
MPGEFPRLHLQHGPIDLIIGCQGSSQAVRAAQMRAWNRFQKVLGELVEELELLRKPLHSVAPLFQGPIARRMAAACRPYAAEFITPMAAVAGAVADDILAAMLEGGEVAKVYVNNGGDIALHLQPGQVFRAGLAIGDAAPLPCGFAEISASSPNRGIATSGWRGRSFSRGIADAVTVLAADAARADAAATMIANAVDAEHPAIRKVPANQLQEESDLGGIPVTVAVGDLPASVVGDALSAGLRLAQDLRRRGLIGAAHLVLADQRVSIGESLSVASPVLRALP